MGKPTLLLIAYRAFGDTLYMAPILPFLFEKYEVVLETNTKGYLLLHDDPRFKEVKLYNEFEGKSPDEYKDLFEARWNKLREEIRPDAEINLNGTLEVTCIGERFQDEFHWPVGERRTVFGSHGFYDAIFERVGLKIPDEFNLSGMWFSQEQEDHCKRWRKKHEGQFVVIIPIAGSTAQKVFHNFKEVAMAILDKYENAFIYLAGDEPCREFAFEHPRVKTMIGNDVSIKQAVHRTKYADMVVGPETFLLVAAGMFGTPKTILATTSSVWQMTQYQRNDFSIQAPAACSPCHRAIYYEDDCEQPVFDEGNKFLTTRCSKMFKVEDIMEKVEWVYRQKFPPLDSAVVTSGPHLPDSNPAASSGSSS